MEERGPAPSSDFTAPQCEIGMDWRRSVSTAALLLLVIAVECKPLLKDPIHLLVAVKNIHQSNQRLANLALMFDSVLRHAARRPLHWIFLIQPKDVQMTQVLLDRIIASKAQVPIQVINSLNFPFIGLKNLSSQPF